MTTQEVQLDVSPTMSQGHMDLRKRQEAMLDFANNIVGELDQHGKHIYLSQSVERVLGVTRDQLIGRSAIEFMPEEDGARLAQALSDLFASGPGAQLHSKFRWSNTGENYRLLDCHALCYERDTGQPAMAFYAADITEQQTMVDSLRTTQARFDAVTRLKDSTFAVLDREGKYLYLSDTVENMLGYTPAELVAEAAASHIHPDDLPKVFTALDELRIADAQTSVRYRFRHKTRDEWVLLESYATNFEDAAGKRLVLANCRDITWRESNAERLRQSERRLESALHATGLGIWEWNLVSGEISVDAAYERLLGYVPGEMSFEGDWPQQYIHPEDVGYSNRHLGESLKTDDSGDGMLLRFKCKNGEWLMATVRYSITERNAEGRATQLIGTIKDVDNEVSARREAQRANRQVELLLLESTEEGICGLDKNGRVTFINSAAETMLGARQGSLLNTQFAKKVFHEDRAGRSQPSPIVAALRDGQRLQRVRASFCRADGSDFPAEYSVSPVLEFGKLQGAVVVFRDETLARRLADRLQHQAVHDAVTALTNRQGFEDAVEELLDSARTQDIAHAMFYLDLDQFRVINATCGHAAGDELLRQLALRLDEELPDYHTLARIGGDEFGVLLENCTLKRAEQVAQHLRRVVEDFSFVRNERVFRFGVCIGVVAINAHSHDRAEILAAADAACFAAKEAGRNRIHVAGESDPVIARRREEMAWAAHTREALDTNRLVLFCQPIVPINPEAGLPRHGEILLRMVGPDGEIIPPGKFLPAAERHFLMPVVDRWVLRRLLTEMSREADKSSRYSVNLSGGTLSEEGLLEEIKGLIDASGVAADRLCFEVTESAAIANLSAALRLMEGLREIGCQFALDDFGTGMSSLTYLRQLPIDYVKIDGKFVRDILDDAVDYAIVQAVYDVTKQLGIRTVAEHVEAQPVLDCLYDIGIDYAQGYHTGRPAPLFGRPAKRD